MLMELLGLLLVLVCNEGAISTPMASFEVIVYEGGNATISCHSNGFPPSEPVSLVNENSEAVGGDNRISKLSNTGSVTMFLISNVQRNDDGRQFRCVLFDSTSPITTIIVYVPPQLIGPRGTVYINGIAGYSHPITYIVDMYPPFTDIMWHLNGTLLRAMSHVSISSTSNSTSLQLRDPTRARDEGTYSVHVSGVSGNTTAIFKLVVMYNKFTEVPSSVSLTVDQRTVLRCCHLFGWSYSWHSNRGPLNDSLKVNMSSDGKVLTYGPVDGADTGLVVTCVVLALDRLTFFTSAPATITVLAPPSISSPSVVTSSEGALEVLLAFSVLSFSGDFSVSYSHGGVTLQANSGRYKTSANGSLTISNPTRQDTGTYTLVARNSLGASSRSIQLLIQYQPVIADLSVDRLVYAVHSNVSIPCGSAVLGLPAPRVSWRKCASETSCLSSSILGNRTHLSLTAVTDADSGTYECTATNNIGHVSLLIPVEVRDPPGAPTLFSVEDNQHGFLLSWSPPPVEEGEEEGEISGYKIVANPLPTTYSDDEGGSGELARNSACVEVRCSAKEKVVRGRDNMAAVLEDLLPAVDYNLTVLTLAYEFQLVSMPSSAITRRTSAGVPGVAMVRAQVQGPSSVNLSWSLSFSGGHPITKFVIELRRNDSSEWHSSQTTPRSEAIDRNDGDTNDDISPDVREVTVFGLEGAEFYLFRVAAYNVLGMGAFTTTPQAILSNLEGVPSAPSRPNITGWGKDQVVISTSIPKLGSTSISWLGLYTVLNGAKQLVMLEGVTDYQEGDALALTWGNISYHGDLTFQIFAVNQFGASLPSQQSLKAHQNIEANSIPSDVGGVVVLSVMMLIDVATAMVAVIICAVIYWESQKKERSIARRIEIVKEATTPTLGRDPPQSPFFFGNEFRSSPDGRSHTQTVQVQTPTTPRGFPIPELYYQDNLSQV